MLSVLLPLLFAIVGVYLGVVFLRFFTLNVVK